MTAAVLLGDVVNDLSCQFCGTELIHTFVDLGKTPLANSYLEGSQLAAPEPCYPLHARVCHVCFLVQVEDAVPAHAIFDDYAYLSSMSQSWLDHAARYSAAAIKRFALGPDSMVVEIASNDGYLLRNFVELGIPCLGVEPAANVAEIAREAGVATETLFFGEKTAQGLAERGFSADLMAANNVLAHVPDLNDFVAGFAALLKPEGVISIEVPHLLNLIEQVQFDTIYHEHFSYLSLFTMEKVFAAHGLRVFDVEQIPTHGGSLRVWICRTEGAHLPIEPNLDAVRLREREALLSSLEGYQGFAPRVQRICDDLIAFLSDQERQGKRVAAYGASAKGNTLFNVAGIGPKQVAFAVDRNPLKQGRYLPGSRIPVYGPEAIREHKPDFVLITPWNIAAEIREQMAEIRDWGGRFVVAVPELQLS